MPKVGKPKTKKVEFQCKNRIVDSTQPMTCALCDTCHSPFMPRSGDSSAEILFIGEAPGEEEDKLNVQFVGDSGKLLRHGIAQAGITSFALDNAIRCRPPHNRDPSTKELKTCKALLYKSIKTMPNLKLLVLVGNHAMMSILGHKGVLEHSGTYQTIDVEGKSYGVLCLMHPSYVLQNQTELNNFMNHISRVPNALTGKLVDPSDEGNYITIASKKDWDLLIDKIKAHGSFIYDLETDALDPYWKHTQITAMSIATVPREAYVVDMIEHSAMILPKLKEIMEDPNIGKIGQNIKFDNLWLKVKYAIEVKNTIWDTSIGQYLLDENESHGLKSMAWKYTKLGGYENLVRGEPHLASGPNLLKYCAIDSDITARIAHIQRPLIAKDAGLAAVNSNLLLPVSCVLKDMEIAGIRVDPVKIDECKTNVDRHLRTIHTKIMTQSSVKQFEQRHAGKTFNPRSPDQLREILYDIEDLEPFKKTAKTKKYSTDRDVLSTYKDDSPLCAALIEHSLYSTMKSKMIKELEEFTVNGRIHTHYWVTETSTGRSSSDDPNLQNVTKGDKDVVGIRNCFIADDDFHLVEFDYNQHELRCMAELAEDVALYDACRSGDAHTATAKSILGKNTISEDERRNVGKTFNFGFIYGLTKYGIKKRLKCSDEVAQNYLDKFFATYWKTKLYMDATTWFVKTNGYVKSKTGRYRRFPIWNELDEKCIREAINMPVQSLAGDILLYSLVGISKYLKDIKAKSYLCLEIHDSLILNVHNSEMDILPEIRNIMLTYFKRFIPFKYDLGVDGKIGTSWGKMEKLVL